MSWAYLRPLVPFIDDAAALANGKGLEGNGLLRDLYNHARKDPKQLAMQSRISGLRAAGQGTTAARYERWVRKVGGYKGTLGQQVGGSLKSGLKMTYQGSWGAYWGLQIPMAAFAAAAAPKGHKVSSFISGAAPLIGSGLGMMVGGMPGMLVGSLLFDSAVQSKVGKAVQSFNEFGQKSAQLHTGGDFFDSEKAWTQRQRASSELSQSLLSARQYLGQEAALLHG